ncbi:hypothetical protein AWJ20_2249 [Sugiyamaella lignohabitans]|uniref:HIT-type domain-containing protein n=1 Tax=Sugiyamaella lignohabitans TaxID=796027 RepID=A0A167EZQ6_9ASCO|nr:uncharacterized protein AWJ20_2249 [Sugiyamaella lignohabitans]ANB14644.1 hypothetical protein AWJ20_2249 [Sugiyamaella lignohabitans]
MIIPNSSLGSESVPKRPYEQLKPVGLGSKFSKAPSASDYLCSLCEASPAKYTCPKCLKLYCSLDCYKGPNHVKCSKLFQESKEQPAEKSSKEEQAKMLKILEDFNLAEPNGWKYELAPELAKKLKIKKDKQTQEQDP